MSALIRIIVAIFRFVIELIVDIVCLALLFASFAAIWRIPFIVLDPCERWSSRSNYRINALASFGTMLLDYFTLPFALATTFTWRGPRMWYDVFSVARNEKFYSIERRGLCLMHALFILIDIPFIAMLAAIHGFVWRIPFFWMDFVKMANKAPPMFLSSEERYRHFGEYRKIIAFHFFNGLVEILLLPAGIPLLITGYRIQPIMNDMDDIKGAEPKHYFQRKLVVMKHFALLLIDLPFGVMGIFTLVTLFRARKLVHDISENRAAKVRRVLIARHFVFAIRDLLVLPLIVPLVVTIYRGIFLIKSLLDAVSPWADARPLIDVTNCRIELPERGTGLIVHVMGTKAADFVLPPGTPVKLYIRNRDFWKPVSSVFGASIASFGQAMLPMTLTPRFIDVAQLKKGSTDGSFIIDLNTHYASSLILKNIKKLGNTNVIVQLEFGAHEGTLFNLDLNLSEFEMLCATGTSAKTIDAIPNSDQLKNGQYLCDVYWKSVLIEFGWFMADIIGLVLFVVLHLFPHRMYRVYSSGCEGSLRRKARKTVKLLEKARLVIRGRVKSTEQSMMEIDTKLREALALPLPSARGEAWTAGDILYGAASSMWNRRTTVDTPSAATAFLSSCAKVSESLGEAGVVVGVTLMQKSTEVYQAAMLAYKRILGTHFEHAFIRPLFSEELFSGSGVPNHDDVADALRQTAVDFFRATGLDGAARAPYPPASTASVAPDGREVDALTYEEQLQLAIDESIRAATKAVASAGAAVVAASAVAAASGVAEAAGALADQARLLLPRRELMTAAQFDLAAQVQLTCPAELLQRVRDDERVFDAKFREAIAAAEEELRRTPWCGGKEGWGGFRNTIFAEAGQLFYDIAAILSFVFCFCTVYRTYSIVTSVVAADDKRKAAVMGVVEIGIDFLYLLKFVATLVGIRSVFTMPADIVLLVLQKPSYTVARQVIDHHFMMLIEDLIKVFSLVIAWDTFRVVLATVVFGLFSPGVMLEGALSRWEDVSGSGAVTISDRSLLRAASLLIFSSAWMFGLPFFIAYFVQGESYNSAATVYFAVMGGVLWLSVAVAAYYRDHRIVAIRRSVVRYLQPSWHNFFTFLSIAIETVQLLALVASVCDESVFGQGVGEALSDASRYVYLIFGQEWAANGLPFGVYFSLTSSLVFFVASAMPIVIGDMLHWRESDGIIRSPLWIATTQFLGQTCLFTVLRNFALVLSCDAASDRVIFSPANPNLSVACWRGAHRGIAVTAMISLVYFIPSSLMRNMKFDETVCRGLDVVYAQLYRVLSGSASATAVVLTLLVRNDKDFVLAVVLVSSTWNVFWCIAYGPLFNKSEGGFCSVLSIQTYRLAAHLAVLGCTVFMFIAVHASDPSTFWALYVCIAIIAACLVGATVRSVLLRCATADDDSIENVRTILLETEAQLQRNNALVLRTWQYVGPRWRSVVASATRSSPLALYLKQLEAHTFAFHLPQLFLRSRGQWATRLTALIDKIDLERELDVDYELSAPDWVKLLICCRCGCDSHMNDGNSSAVPYRSEVERTETLFELVTALRNAVRQGSEQQPTIFDDAPFLQPQYSAAEVGRAAPRTPPPVCVPGVNATATDKDDDDDSDVSVA